MHIGPYGSKLILMVANREMNKDSLSLREKSESDVSQAIILKPNIQSISLVNIRKRVQTETFSIHIDLS